MSGKELEFAQKHPGPHSNFDNQQQPVTLLAYINVVLQHRKLIAMCLILCATSAYVFSKLSSPVYEATAQFISDPDAASKVIIAGAGMRSTTLQDPVDYYSNILKSSAVLDKALDREFPQSNDLTSHTVKKLIDILNFPTDSGVSREVLARNFFKERSIVSLETRTRTSPVLNLSAQWNDPKMAAALANVFLEELVAYDTRIKTGAFNKKRVFIEKRVEEVIVGLQKAENNLLDFELKNRLIYRARPGSSQSPVPPQLQVEKDRRDREVQVQSELYMTLKNELELAKIAEDNKESTLVVIEWASAPLQSIFPQTLFNVILGTVVGLALGIAFAFLLELVARVDTNSHDSREFREHIVSLRTDVRRLVSILSFGLAAWPPPSKGERVPSSN